MIRFAVSFLIRTVRFTEEDVSTLPAKNRAFQSLDVREFLAVIGKDKRKRSCK